MLTLGSSIAGAGFLMLGLLALLFRHPNLPRWARPEFVPMLICIRVAGMIGVGLAYIVVGLWQLLNGTVDWIGLLTLAAVVIGLAWVWRFGLRGRLAAYASAAAEPHGS